MPAVKVRTRVTTANIASTLSVTAARADYAAAVIGTDILCTQEDHTRDSAAFVPDGWGTFQAASKRCSVHWRTDRYELVDKWSALLNERHNMTFPGARRIAAAVLLRDLRNQKTILAISPHFVPHADDDQGGITDMPRRVLVNEAIGSLIAFSAAHPADVEIIAGDTNIDLDKDLSHRDRTDMLERVNTAGFRSDVQQLGATTDTHGTSEYDWLLARGGTWVAHQTRPKGRSDHRAKTAVVEY